MEKGVLNRRCVRIGLERYHTYVHRDPHKYLRVCVTVYSQKRGNEADVLSFHRSISGTLNVLNTLRGYATVPVTVEFVFLVDRIKGRETETRGSSGRRTKGSRLVQLT